MPGGRKQGHLYAGKTAVSESHISHLWSSKNTLNPNHVSTDHSGTAIWFNSSCGHEWKLGIRYQAQFPHCRVCYPGKVIPNVNDVVTKRPDLVKDWHPDNLYGPHQLHEYSNQVVHWRCSVCQYETNLSVGIRAKAKNCIACAGQALQSGFNDFLTKCPEAVHYWHPDNDLSPQDVYFKSSIVVKWICPRKHVWKSAVHYRTLHGCPDCAREKTTKVSKGELSVREFIKELGYPYLPNRRDLIKPYEIDIIVEKSKLAIEFNGDYWHSSQVKASYVGGQSMIEMPGIKKSMCEAQGYQLVFVWEHDWNIHKEIVKDALKAALLSGTTESSILLNQKSVLDSACNTCAKESKTK